MEPAGVKPSFLRNILVRLFVFCVLFVGFRFAYVVTIRGESCDLGDFCFFSVPENLNLVAGVAVGQLGSSSAVIVDHAARSTPANNDLWTTREYQEKVEFYVSVFHDLVGGGYLSAISKALCIDTPAGEEVFALKEIGVLDSIGIYKKTAKPLVVNGEGSRIPFGGNTFDFVFAAAGTLDKSAKPAEFAAEVGRTLKPQGILVVHTASKDTYSFNSFIDLFNCCTFIHTREIEHSIDISISSSSIREFVMKKKEIQSVVKKPNGSSENKCSVPGYKQELVRKAEPLIVEEPLKPWITLKKNIKNIKYLSSMADINFKHGYVYVDVGARSYGSSIASWFKKQYPKQNKTFDIYAIEADKTFHEEYRYKKGVTLLPYAAWVRNEKLFFEINQDPGHKEVEKGRGMGRIQPVQQSSEKVSDGDVDKIQGFDFANWLKSTVSEKDYVVMKMDVEGTEFDLIPRLFDTGAICLIDEIFLECHYNRWQRCCPGERSPKYEKTYGQCLELFASLRQSGVLVHQWW